MVPLELQHLVDDTREDANKKKSSVMMVFRGRN
jgi:hypothetical protein